MFCFLLFEREKKYVLGERKMARGLFSQGRHVLLAGLHWDFKCCQVQLKAVLRVSS
jgi:hypothetical protein